MEQTVIEPSATYLDPFRQNKGSLKLSSRDSTVEIDALRVIGLFAADDKLIVFDGDAEIRHRKSGDGERDAKRILPELLDVIRWVAVA